MQGSINCDVMVIGGGIGGYVSAIRSAQLGNNVVLVEKDVIGGTCLNHGCIPTCTLLATADLLRTIKTSVEHGIKMDNLDVDLQKINNRKNEVVNRLVKGVQYLLKKNKITLIDLMQRSNGILMLSCLVGVSLVAIIQYNYN